MTTGDWRGDEGARERQSLLQVGPTRERDCVDDPWPSDDALRP